jgi:hypothetical protein
MVLVHFSTCITEVNKQLHTTVPKRGTVSDQWVLSYAGTCPAHKTDAVSALRDGNMRWSLVCLPARWIAEVQRGLSIVLSLVSNILYDHHDLIGVV